MISGCKVWWKQTPKALSVAEQIISSVNEQDKSIVIHGAQYLPWKEQLYRTVREEIEKKGLTSLKRFDSPDDPGAYLLEHYCSDEDKLSYRSQKTYGDFLADCKSFSGRKQYFWVDDISESQAAAWMNFIQEYIQKSQNSGVIFILLINSDKYKGDRRKKVNSISYPDEIKWYDIFSFCALMSSEINIKDELRPYLVEMSATICQNDPELAEKLIRKDKSFLQNPAAALAEIRQDERNSSGSEFETRQEEIDKLIWKVQVKQVFPVLEEYRSNFVSRYFNYLEQVLQSKPEGFQGDINNIQEIELGPLKWLSDTGRLQLLENERDALEKFREARNKLAHLDKLNYNEVENILSWNQSAKR